MNERAVGRSYSHLPLDAASADHLQLHRLWAFAKLQVDLELAEHSHILACNPCRNALQACLRADHFGAVLKQLDPSAEEGDRPRIGFLYVVARDRKLPG